MGVSYDLVNLTKKQCVGFYHLAASKVRELAGDPVSAAIVTWYMLQNRGDRITFVPDQYPDREWPCPDVSHEEILSYPDVTDQVVDSLIQAGILGDEGIEYLFEDEPEVYLRRLRNVWYEPTAPGSSPG
jgi:hypothetical protein